MLKVCAWCPMTAEEINAIRCDDPVSHGICEAHSEEMLGVLYERRNEGIPALSGER